MTLTTGLSNGFKKYIENAHNLCIYKLGSQYVASNIFFPNANVLTLINCHKNGVSNILNRDRFPNLNRVNYISVRPYEENIHKRLPSSVEWVFPDKNYDFYNAMVERGLGKKSSTLIRDYVATKTVIDGKNGFDISFQFDLNIPDYGIVNGEWWRRQFQLYLNEEKKKATECQGLATQFHMQESEEKYLEKERVKFELNNLYFEEDD
jgi:hypothetical protein